MLSDVSIGMEVQGDNAVAKLQECCADLQRKFGQQGSNVKNAVHCSSSDQGRKADVETFFSNEIATSAIFNNCSLCVIKPHVIADGHAGEVIDWILEEGFEISAMQMFNIDKPTASEFLEIYRGVLPEFSSMVE